MEIPMTKANRKLTPGERAKEAQPQTMIDPIFAAIEAHKEAQVALQRDVDFDQKVEKPIAAPSAGRSRRQVFC